MFLQVLTLICLALIVQSHPLDKGYKINWVRLEKDEIPENAVRGGDGKHGPQYVGKGYFKGDWMPGKYVPALKKFYVAWNGLEHEISDFKVLTMNEEYIASWIDVESDEKNIDSNALIAAETNDGDTLHVGRRHMHNGYHIGKVSLRQMKCFIPYDGNELAFDDFEVLIISKKIKEPQKDKKIEINIIKNT